MGSTKEAEKAGAHQELGLHTNSNTYLSITAREFKFPC